MYLFISKFTKIRYNRITTALQPRYNLDDVITTLHPEHVIHTLYCRYNLHVITHRKNIRPAWHTFLYVLPTFRQALVLHLGQLGTHLCMFCKLFDRLWYQSWASFQWAALVAFY
jgi:hypothetical protein